MNLKSKMSYLSAALMTFALLSGPAFAEELEPKKVENVKVTEIIIAVEKKGFLDVYKAPTLTKEELQSEAASLKTSEEKDAFAKKIKTQLVKKQNLVMSIPLSNFELDMDGQGSDAACFGWGGWGGWGYCGNWLRPACGWGGGFNCFRFNHFNNFYSPFWNHGGCGLFW